MFTVCSAAEMLPERKKKKTTAQRHLRGWAVRCVSPAGCGVSGAAWTVLPLAWLNKRQHEGTWHLPTQQGHFSGPDTSLAEPQP